MVDIVRHNERMIGVGQNVRIEQGPIAWVIYTREATGRHMGCLHNVVGITAAVRQRAADLLPRPTSAASGQLRKFMKTLARRLGRRDSSASAMLLVAQRSNRWAAYEVAPALALESTWAIVQVRLRHFIEA
jgi:hypothetical protein